MHRDSIDAALAARLVSAQFPQWANLSVVPVEVDGWDNRTFRLGHTMTVRLPSAEGYVQSVGKEHRAQAAHVTEEVLAEHRALRVYGDRMSSPHSGRLSPNPGAGARPPMR